MAASRQQIQEPGRVSVDDVIKDMELSLRGLAGDSIRLVTELSPNLLFVRMEKTQLEQIILNLVVNARDAMPWAVY